MTRTINLSLPNYDKLNTIASKSNLSLSTTLNRIVLNFIKNKKKNNLEFQIPHYKNYYKEKLFKYGKTIFHYQIRTDLDRKVDKILNHYQIKMTDLFNLILCYTSIKTIYYAQESNKSRQKRKLGENKREKHLQEIRKIINKTFNRNYDL